VNPFGTVQLAALLAAGGAGFVLLARSRVPLLTGFAAIALAETVLARSRDGAPSPTVVAGGAAALLVGVGAALLLARRPALVIPLLLAAAPFRLPLNFDPDHRFLVAVAEAGQLGRLLPLYGMLGVAVLELSLRALRSKEVLPIPRALAFPSTAFVALACLSLAWSDDVSAGRNLLGFFVVPFVVLVAVAARAPFPRWLPRVLAIEGVALAALFATIGIWEAATKELIFFTPNIEVANSYASYFRVTSLFRDPSLYGRQVVLGIAIVLVAVFLRRIGVLWGAAIIALLWAGLFFSYSQSSLLALFAAVVFVMLVAGGKVGRRAVAAAAVVSAVGAGAAALVIANTSEASTQRATSDRSRRVELTARVFAHHPVAGVGFGAQPRETQRISPRPGPPSKFVSHATPLTVAAELGVIGLIAYVALLAGGVRILELARRLQPALGLALEAVVLALVVHSLFYSGFFEDPITWLALAIAANVVTRGGVEPSDA
jgi:putative inorganic carbon (HCO3(-)) transporter